MVVVVVVMRMTMIVDDNDDDAFKVLAQVPALAGPHLETSTVLLPSASARAVDTVKTWSWKTLTLRKYCNIHILFCIERHPKHYHQLKFHLSLAFFVVAISSKKIALDHNCEEGWNLDEVSCNVKQLLPLERLR